MHHVDRICACRFGRAAAIAGSTGESAKFNSIMERQHGSEERTQGGKEGRTQGREERRKEVSEKASLAVRQHSWLY